MGKHLGGGSPKLQLLSLSIAKLPIENHAKYLLFRYSRAHSSFQHSYSRAHARTHAVLAQERVKYRVVILGSLAEAWHCSREYRVERVVDCLVPAAMRTPLLALDLALSSLYCTFVFPSPLFSPSPYATTYSLPMLRHRLSFPTHLRVCPSPSLSWVRFFFPLLFLFLPSLTLEALEFSLLIRFYLCNTFVSIFRVPI